MINSKIIFNNIGWQNLTTFAKTKIFYFCFSVAKNRLRLRRTLLDSGPNVDQERFPERQNRIDRFRVGRRFGFDVSFDNFVVVGFKNADQKIYRTIEVSVSEKAESRIENYEDSSPQYIRRKISHANLRWQEEMMNYSQKHSQKIFIVKALFSLSCY